MKKRVLKAIYQHFDLWSSELDFACRKGCSVCCTQNVTMTSLEGDYIMDFIRENRTEEWLRETMVFTVPLATPAVTTNEYAKACLDGRDIDPGNVFFEGTCPFLSKGNCSIYEARPFSCRSFASMKICSPGSSASVPQFFLTAVTAVSQIIEHLDQRHLWGNMLNIVYLLSQQHERTEEVITADNQKKILLAQTGCRSAKPLPGFLVGEEDFPLVSPLLETIFDTEVQGKTIENILNNR